MKRVAPYLKLTRFPLVFTAVADSLAGYAITLGTRPPSPWKVTGLVVASAGLYACGMVFNDVFDATVDRLRHKERPIPSGQVKPDDARKLGMGLFIAATVAACGVHFMAGLAAFLAFILIMLYDGFFKRGPLGAGLMGSVRFVNFALGILAAGLEPRQLLHIPAGAWGPAAILGGYVVVLTLLSQSEEKPSRWALVACGVLMMAAPTGAYALGPSYYSLASASAAVLLIGGVTAAGAANPTKETTMRAVLWGVLAIILIDATFVLAAGRLQWGAAIAGLLVPALLARPLFKHL
jgi:4-hydroxybenzoate polyprenyltransferase